MSKKASPFFLFLVLHILIGALNFSSYIMGESAVWYEHAASWIYMCIALGTLWFSKGNKKTIFVYIVFSAVLLFSSVFTALVNMDLLSSTDFIVLVPITVFSIAPLYGVEAAFSGNYFFASIAIGVFGLIWLSVSMFFAAAAKREM